MTMWKLILKMTIARFAAEILFQLSKMLIKKAEEKKEELREMEEYIKKREEEMREDAA